MGPSNFVNAVEDFNRAHRQAILKEIIARIKGESITLLSYDQIRHILKAQDSSERGVQDIPLEAIVGSVNRYNDFTRDFLPLHGVHAERWANVELAAVDAVGLPPIEVYKIGEIFFVKDGNHRVSVARQLGAKEIQAYVTEIKTGVPLTTDLKPEDLILKAEYASFLERTHLDQIRPKSNQSVTAAGQYSVLEEHISVHRYYMGLEQQREIPYEEAVAHWYDTVYLPVTQLFRETGILKDFPGRTETDLYLWLAEHRAALESELGWEINPADAARDLASQFSLKPDRVAARLKDKIQNTIGLKPLEAGPPPGYWRRERIGGRVQSSLYLDVLIPINGQQEGWCAVDQAIVIAQRERAYLHGLYVVALAADKDSQESQSLKEEFSRRCKEAHVKGSLVVAVGEVSQNVCSRARWADLIVVNLAHPPSSQPVVALSSGFRLLVQRCPVPVLAVPRVVSPLEHASLAYDGSPKAREALYVSAYLAGKWNISLIVTSVLENNRVDRGVLAEAQHYLEEHGVIARYLPENGPVAETIMKTAGSEQCDFLILGGYGHSPILEVVLGSTVDQLLRESQIPMLICR